ncbi:hypothetical protein [Proteiniphilum sp. X52]|uniref:hypothetical protein n=1 Tax=Proteiniphilum sp. X52 TaxID=2382159 RepID=UPI000F0A4B17|nr:hypothetical protein [Proteiniphilum sp. X52]RNC65141.1 hypothetical protein D7D25_08195 [Proteiniphilum sp. X52]
MIKILILGFAILFIAILLMGIRVFFTKNGEFPSLHIGDSKPLQDKGIHCATSQDAEISRRESPIEKMLKSENI